MPLVAGLLALSLSALLGIASLSSLTLERHRLQALAEATALRASESFDPALVTRHHSGAIAPLSSPRIRQAAIDSLRQQSHQHDRLQLLRADTPDGLRARVVLQSRWSPPMWSEFLPGSVIVRAESVSRPVIG